MFHVVADGECDMPWWPVDATVPGKFDERVRDLLLAYTQETGPARATTEAGDRYVEITNVLNGDTLTPVWHMSFDAVWTAWSGQMLAYLEGKTHIVWRIKPEIDQQTVYDVVWLGEEKLRPATRFKIYARLFAS